MKKAVFYFRTALWLFLFGTVLVGVGSAWAVEREWLILFYISGANDRGLSGFAKDVINQQEKVGSTDKVSVVVTYTILGRNKVKHLQFQREVKTLLIRPVMNLWPLPPGPCGLNFLEECWKNG